MTDKALVVDDNEVNRVLARRLLAKAGWSVEEAEDGHSALSLLAAGPFDLVLLDISMPGIDGEEVCAAVRRGEAGDPDVCVVAYTAHAMEEDRLRFHAAGFDGVLVKPITRDSIHSCLARIGLLPEKES